MIERPFSLVHLIRKPLVASATPPLVVLLHGFGSNAEDLFGLAGELDPRFLVVSVQAPYTLGYGAYAWFHFSPVPAVVTIATDEAENSRKLILKFLDEIITAYHVDTNHVYLMGFSQGAIMSLDVALTQPQNVSGVVAMSGRLMPQTLDARASEDALKKLSVLVVHGTMDNVLPIYNGRAIRDEIAKLPIPLTYHEYDMGHNVTPESLADVTHWLTERLSIAATPR
jgi:phospholipase/carboxylesterase